MSFDIRLSASGRTVVRNLGRVFDRRTLYAVIVALLNRRAQVIAGHVSSRMTRNGRVGRRSGSLARSVVGVGQLVDGIPAMRVGVLSGPSLKYAGVQEFGTKGKNPQSPYDTIRPRNGKYLAIPVNDAVTPVGLPRYESARKYPRPLVFRRGSATGRSGGLPVSGGAGLYEVPNGNAEGKLVYVLLRKADIRPKFYLRDGFKESFPGQVKVLEGELNRALQLAIFQGEIDKFKEPPRG